MELTPKQKAFADYYIECGKVTEAAVKAGYSKKTAAKIGSENLKKPDVSAYIAQRQSQIDSERICSIKISIHTTTQVVTANLHNYSYLYPSIFI